MLRSWDCWAKLPQIPRRRADLLQELKSHRGADRQPHIFPSPRPKAYASVSGTAALPEHVEHFIPAFHSLLLRQSCTQTKRMADQMQFGVLAPDVRITNRLLRFGKATNKGKTKQTDLQQPESVRDTVHGGKTYCYEKYCQLFFYTWSHI